MAVILGVLSALYKMCLNWILYYLAKRVIHTRPKGA
jgi:hypothetical protein